MRAKQTKVRQYKRRKRKEKIKKMKGIEKGRKEDTKRRERKD